jgi:hypothetical protein
MDGEMRSKPWNFGMDRVPLALPGLKIPWPYNEVLAVNKQIHEFTYP